MTEAPPKQPITGTESVSMGAATGLPQYDDPNIAPPITPGYGAAMASQPGLVAVRQQVNADPFAVFQALQDRMEAERMRAQRRTSAMIFCFSLLLVIFVGGIFAFFFLMMRNMQGTQNNLLQAALEGVGMRKEVVAQPISTPIAAPSPASAQPNSELMSKMEKMSQMLEMVQKDNEALRTSVQEANKAVVAATAAAAEAVEAAKSKKPVSYVKPLTPRTPEATEQVTTPTSVGESKEVASSVKPITQEKNPTALAKPVAEKAVEKTDASLSEATKVAAENLQRVSVGKIAPGLKVNRVAPAKGHKADTIELANHTGETISWRVQLPTEAK